MPVSTISFHTQAWLIKVQHTTGYIRLTVHECHQFDPEMYVWLGVLGSVPA
jgi:hypothetical protein